MEMGLVHAADRQWEEARMMRITSQRRNSHVGVVSTFIVALFAYRDPTRDGRWCASALSRPAQPMTQLNVFAVE